MTAQQAANQMRREVKGLCHGCGDPLPAWKHEANAWRQHHSIGPPSYQCTPCWSAASKRRHAALLATPDHCG